MKMRTINTIKSKEEARQIAIDYQTWANKRSMTYTDISQWQGYFETLARKFNLVKEFKENGIV